MDYKIELGNKLKELRKSCKLTQKETAKNLNISVTCYAGYEQGYREPDIFTLKKICEFFDEDANALIGINRESETAKKGKNIFIGINNGTIIQK